MIHESFDNKTPAIISPKRKENAQKIDTVIIIFSYLIEEYILKHFECKKIAVLSSCASIHHVYQINYQGKKIAFFKTEVGASITVGFVEDALIELEFDKLIMFGGAGCLDKEIARGKIMIPIEAYRDEGTSYHYAVASDYIKIKNYQVVAEFMECEKIPYVLGKTWTTDAFYRETRGNFEKRKKDGCISVEMEVSAVQAVCDFRGIEFYSFLKGGDLLDAPMWDARYEFSHEEIAETQHDPKYFIIALHLAAFISK